MKKIVTVITLLALLVAIPSAMAARTVPAFQKVRATRLGKASWYSRTSPGTKNTTANNEIFDDSQMTCAMWGVGFNRKIRVVNLANNKSVIVRVNDRGPSERYVKKGRIIDLSHGAFTKISDPKDGIIEVRVEFLAS